MVWLIFTLFLSLLVTGKNPEPEEMYLDEVAVGDDAYELALAEDEKLEREVGLYNEDDLKEKEPWDMTSEYANYEGIDDVEDLDSDSSERRLIKDHRHTEASKEEALASPKKHTKKKKHKTKKKLKKKTSHKKKKSEDFDHFEHGLSLTEKDDEILQMQHSIETDQNALQSLMQDFEKKLGDYENAKISVETSLGHIDEDSLSSSDDDEVAVGSSEDSQMEKIMRMFEDLDELPVGIFEDFDELPVGMSEDLEELPVGEEFDYDEWLEKELGEMPLDYQQWHETALGEIEKMDDEIDYFHDPDDELRDFEETLVGDPLEDMHADMNDMFDNILYENFDSEDQVGDWIEDDDEIF